jgi:pantoate--beta-alanine ligase
MLFRMVQPERAYFGEKDYQQLQVVKRMAQDLRLDVEVIGCPTIREHDGLACSSRNVYLEGDTRARAVTVYQALQAAQAALSNGERQGARLDAIMAEVIAQTDGAQLDYAAVVDAATLEPLSEVTEDARALIAVHLGGVHLIDNAPLIPRHQPRSPRAAKWPCFGRWGPSGGQTR